jgi:hypothetical protein
LPLVVAQAANRIRRGRHLLTVKCSFTLARRRG